MFYDDLPIWGFIGKIEKILHPGDHTQYKYYLFTHIHFDILYNGNRVIEVRSSYLMSPANCLAHLRQSMLLYVAGRRRESCCLV